MLNPVSEPVMQKALEDYIARKALDDVLADFPKAHAVRNVVLAGHAFNQIKVHLRALGLNPRRSFKIGGQKIPLADPAFEPIKELLS